MPDVPVLPHRIELRLRDIDQLFNNMDPSPFHQKDLDPDAEEYILTWAQDFPFHEPIALTIHVEDLRPGQVTPQAVQSAVQRYFGHRAELTHLELRRLWREGRTSALIGLTFLATCLTLAEVVSHLPWESVGHIVQEGLTITGWVAMWRPIHLYLYEWWPLARRKRVFRKMAKMPVEMFVGLP